MYTIIREALFHFDPEKVHHFSMGCLQKACNIPFIHQQIKQQFTVTHPSLERKLWNLHFKNPVGLGAGFDKNALYIQQLAALGFGFVEIGTVTPKPQAGNEQPRLFRLPQDKALVNRMGFNNEGVVAVKRRLEALQNKSIIVGGNIGKNKVTPNEDAWKDYEICFKQLHHCVDYFVVNVSSPNTPGLRALQEKEALGKILSHLQHINQGMRTPKPLLLKIAPDLTQEQLDDIVALSFEVQLDGLVATNTTISRADLRTNNAQIQQIGAGGLSGLPIKAMSNRVTQYLHQQTSGKVPIIGSGGIFSGQDAAEKMALGASLIQVWTGFVYQGPAIASNICNYLINQK